MPEFSPEFRLLLDSALHPLQEPEIRRLQASCRPDLDWPAFAALVERQRVFPTVYNNLSRYTPQAVPQPVLVALRQRAEQNRQHVLLALAELRRISEGCAQAGIPICLLKGPLLAQTLFGDLSLRTAKDLDVLAHPLDQPQIDALLLAGGWQRTYPPAALTPRQQQAFQREWHHSTYLLPQRRLTLELHWDFTSPHLVPPEVVAHMLDRALPAAASGVRTLSPADLPVYLLLHGAAHNWVRLKWLLDFAAWLRQSQTAQVEALAMSMQRLGLQRCLAQGALLAGDLFSIPLPAALQQVVARVPQGRQLADHSLKALLDPAYRGEAAGQMLGAGHILYLMRLKNGLPHRWSAFRRLWFLPEDWADLPLPDPLFPLYVPLRPFLWLRRSRQRALTRTTDTP